MQGSEQFARQAEFLRESSGSTNIPIALHKALKILKLFNIPHSICGGFAVQEHGYPRFTTDVDIIVPDVQFAREALLGHGFRTKPGSIMTVIDRETQVEIDLLPGGGRVGSGPVSFPVPAIISDKPQILELADLLSLKLSSHMGSPIHRAQDYADAVKLIQVNRAPRALRVDPKVREVYQELWDRIQAAVAPDGPDASQ